MKNGGGWHFACLKVTAVQGSGWQGKRVWLSRVRNCDRQKSCLNIFCQTPDTYFKTCTDKSDHHDSTAEKEEVLACVLCSQSDTFYFVGVNYLF